jgi:hypothetical protein
MYMPNGGLPQGGAGRMDGSGRMLYNPATGQYSMGGNMHGGGQAGQGQNAHNMHQGGRNMNMQPHTMGPQGGHMGGGGHYGMGHGQQQMLPGGMGIGQNGPMGGMGSLHPRGQMMGGMGGPNDLDGGLFHSGRDDDRMQHGGMMGGRGMNMMSMDMMGGGGGGYDRMDRDRRDRDGYRDGREMRGRDRDRDRDRGYNNGRNGNGGAVSPIRDSLVEEFRSTYGKSRQWGLRDLLGHVVAFCQDQHGSRFIQQRLEVCSDVDKQLIFDEIIPSAQSLMTDVFGNYVLQKLFEYGTADQCEALALLLKGQSVQLAMQMYGCRVVQKALEYVSTQRLIELVSEFENPPVSLCLFTFCARVLCF